MLTHFQKSELIVCIVHALCRCLFGSILALSVSCPSKGWKREMFLPEEQTPPASAQLCSDKSQKCFLLSQVPTRLGNYRNIIQGCSSPQELKIKSRVCDTARLTVPESVFNSRNTNCSLLKLCGKGLERESRTQVLIICKCGCLALG